MSHTITFDASDIRSALFAQAQRDFPNLFKNKITSITLAGDGTHIVVTLTFRDPSPDARD